jgi:hypothetical protein
MSEMPEILRFRHSSTQHLMSVLFPSNALEPDVFRMAQHTWDYALELCASMKDGPELAAGLRKLIEGRDCFARQIQADRFHSQARTRRDSEEQALLRDAGRF